jgi:hypothetical protein
LRFAGIVYSAIAALVVLDFGALKVQQFRISQRLKSHQAEVDVVTKQRKHWIELSPAFDENQAVVEILDQVRESLPADNLQLTNFELIRGSAGTNAVTSLILEGEAPSVDKAIDLVENLRKRATLRRFQFVADAPVILPNRKTRFRITGKSTPAEFTD